jgi:hypothetical protein
MTFFSTRAYKGKRMRLKKGTVSPGWIGDQMQTVTQDIADSPDLKQAEAGSRITSFWLGNSYSK